MVTLQTESPCDSHILSPGNDPYGYRLRGDRCEGIYIQEVAGTPLGVASWTQYQEDYDLSSGAPLILEWDALPESRSIHLRAHALRRRLYFQMDAIQSANNKFFTWKPDLLAAIGIPGRELGVVGLTKLTVGKTERDVYVPIRLRQKTHPAASSHYELVVIPGVELKELFVTIAPAEGGQFLKNGEPLGYGYYPAERPIAIPISRPSKPGIYHLGLGATQRNGGVSTTELWFFHPQK